ncbi:MAG: hypothetical protein AAFY11_03560 [Cyanobacteria bacterium J06641_5]
MAAPDLVKRYLALWFQLGKRVASIDGCRHWQPATTLHGERYAPEFERCWREMINDYRGACYLEGTSQTLAELLSPAWDIVGCPRCPIPIPMRPSGAQPDACPCDDRPLWPNLDLPAPHAPLSSQDRLARICDRLTSHYGSDEVAR